MRGMQTGRPDSVYQDRNHWCCQITNPQKRMKKKTSGPTGLLFGSFNPVHIAHLIIAEYFVQHTDIEEVWFILSPQNPLKETQGMLCREERMDLLQMALNDNPVFAASDIEFTMPAPSYTIDTINKLLQEYPSRSFVLLIGMDNLEDFHRWKGYMDILNSLPCYVYPRGEGERPDLAEHPGVHIVGAPQLEISSSFIRRSIAGGKTTRYMLPENVWRRIKEKGHYLSGG